jgi:hypothetical protein
VVRALPAVVAGRAPVVGLAVDGHRHQERVQLRLDLAAPVGRHQRGELRGTGGHGQRPGAGRVAQRGRLRQLVDVAGHADQLLDLVVDRGDLVVVEGPVVDVGALDGAQQAALAEVDVPEPRRLGVPVDGAAAHGLGQVLHGAHVAGLGVGGVPAVGAGLGHRIGRGEAPAGLELVAREPRPGDLLGEVVEPQVALVEHHDVVAGLGQHHGRGGPAGAAAHHQRLHVSRLRLRAVKAAVPRVGAVPST